MPVLFEVNKSSRGDVAVTSKQTALCQAQGNCRHVMQEERGLVRVQLPSPSGKQNPAPRWEPSPWSQTSLASLPHCPSWRFGHEVWEPSFVLLTRRGVAMGASASPVGGVPPGSPCLPRHPRALRQCSVAAPLCPPCLLIPALVTFY